MAVSFQNVTLLATIRPHASCVSNMLFKLSNFTLVSRHFNASSLFLIDQHPVVAGVVTQ